MNRMSLHYLGTLATLLIGRTHAMHRAAHHPLPVERRLRPSSRVIKYGLLLIVASLSQNALGQTNTCGIAMAQLESYIARVNDIANAEYYQNIPIRCSGNPYCMQGLLGELSHWYLQQAALVDELYSQLIQECTQQRTTRQIPSRRQTRDEPGRLDEDTIKDLRVDDEDKTVRIRIPSTPRGFK